VLEPETNASRANRGRINRSNPVSARDVSARISPMPTQSSQTGQSRQAPSTVSTLQNQLDDDGAPLRSASVLDCRVPQ
jgi:hypothetical protein